jgi:hypothetical protein
MGSSNALTYVSDKLERGEATKTNLLYRITGAKTMTDLSGNAAKWYFDTAPTQAVIDAFLGTTNEILAAGYGTTALGTDAVGFLIDMGGQCASLINIEIRVFSGTSTATKTGALAWGSSTALPNTLTTDAQLGANGNIGCHFVCTGLDAITDGLVELVINLRAK